MTKRETCKWASSLTKESPALANFSVCNHPLPSPVDFGATVYVSNADCDRCRCWKEKKKTDGV